MGDGQLWNRRIYNVQQDTASVQEEKYTLSSLGFFILRVLGKIIHQGTSEAEEFSHRPTQSIKRRQKTGIIRHRIKWKNMQSITDAVHVRCENAPVSTIIHYCRLT